VFLAETKDKKIIFGLVCMQNVARVSVVKVAEDTNGHNAQLTIMFIL